jgi:hypothetical protein
MYSRNLSHHHRLSKKNLLGIKKGRISDLFKILDSLSLPFNAYYFFRFRKKAKRAVATDSSDAARA